MRHHTIRPLAAALLLAAVALPAHALLNPNFTPKHVEAQSKLLAAVRVEAVAEEMKEFTLAVADVIKGKTDTKAIRVDLSGCRKITLTI
jgi:hypothetical protein